MTLDTVPAHHRGEAAVDGATVAALLYLALPSFLFLVGWFRPLVAFPSALLLAFMIARACRWRVVAWRTGHTAAALGLVAASAALWAAFGGAGHLFWANRDWAVRDAVFADLAFTDWPVAYAADADRALLLRSAIGYFLPAAVLVKAVGASVMDFALYVWTALGAGLFLLLLPLPRRAGLPLLGAILLVVFFSGMDNLGILLETGAPPIFPLSLSWWVPFNYPSPTGQLYWAPNHALPLWISSALFIRHWRHSEFPAVATAMVPLLPLWTPFSVLGLAPLYLVLLVHLLRAGRFTAALAGRLALAVVAALPVLWMLTLDIDGIRMGGNIEASVARVASFAAGGQSAESRYVAQYLLFILMEFGILAFFVGRHLRHSHALFGVACVTLVLLPFGILGPSNDLLLRVSAPALVVLLALTLSVLRDAAQSDWRRALPIGAVLVIGAQTPLHEIWAAATYRRSPPNYARTLLDVQRGYAPPHYVASVRLSGITRYLRQPAVVTGQAGRPEATRPTD